MLTLFLWSKVSSLVILLRILLALHCVRHRQLVDVGVESGLGFISNRRHPESEVGAAVSASAVPPPKRLIDE